MAKRSSASVLAMLAPDRKSPVSLQRQLYKAIRKAILEGGLPPGTRLPSTRALASDWGLGRNTVVNAFEQLAAEGYLESRVGSGTYVSEKLPEEYLHVDSRPQARREQGVEASAKAPELTGRANWYASLELTPDPDRPVPFSPGVPAVDAFPVEQWRRITARQLRRVTRSALACGDAMGYPPLRRSLAAYLNTARGVRCRWEQILVLSSSQQALDLTARILLEPTHQVWMENPGYLGARGALGAAGAELVPVPVDEDGLDVSQGLRRAPQARLVYATPSHHFPLGSMLSLRRRLELMDWASQAGAWILEDDYDSEFRYSGNPLAAMQGLDESGRVIYVGTLSKVLFPSLRLGYMVVPERLMDSFARARSLIDGHAPSLPQRTLTEFIEEGHFASHIRRMRSLYRQRQTALLKALDEHVGGPLDYRRAESGMHLVARLPQGASLDDTDYSRRAFRHRVDAPSLSRYYLERPVQQGFLLGFCGVPSRELKRGAKVLGDILRGRIS